MWRSWVHRSAVPNAHRPTAGQTNCRHVTVDPAMASASTRQARSRAMLTPNSPTREITRRSATTRMQARIGRVASFAEMRTPAILVEKPVVYLDLHREQGQCTGDHVERQDERQAWRSASGLRRHHVATADSSTTRCRRPCCKPRPRSQRARSDIGVRLAGTAGARAAAVHHRVRQRDRRRDPGRDLPGPDRAHPRRRC